MKEYTKRGLTAPMLRQLKEFAEGHRNEPEGSIAVGLVTRSLAVCRGRGDYAFTCSREGAGDWVQRGIRDGAQLA